MEFFIENYTNFLILHKIPYQVGFFLWYAIEFVLIAVLILISVFIFIFAERKILAIYTINKRPNCIGLGSCLQTVADTVKLMFKENIIPEKADKTLFVLAPIIYIVPIIISCMILPLSSGFLPIKSDVAVLLFITVMLMPALGILCAGYSSANKFSLSGALRVCSQMISYEIPLVISVMAIVVLSGTMSLQKIVEVQYANGLLSWFCFPAFIGFIVFFISALAEMKRTPFDFSKSESELVKGYNTEYSGMKFAMFYIGEYAFSFVLCMFAVLLFFGGYLPPVPFFLANFFEDSSLLYGLILSVEQFLHLIVKTFILLFLVILTGIAVPRLRSDMITSLCWKYLIPLSLLNLLIVCLIKLGGFYG